MSIELLPLATAKLTLGTPKFLPQGPKGTRVIVDIVAAEWDGDRLKARQTGGPAGDWALVSADGTLSIDVRSTLETHDGASIFVSYLGRSDRSKGADAPIFVTPLFETNDPRYAWLNRIQAVGRGRSDGAGGLIYEFYELA